MATFNEAVFEESALGWLANLGWQVIRGGTSRLNPLLPAEAWENALSKLALPSGSNIVARNREFHRMLGRERRHCGVSGQRRRITWGASGGTSSLPISPVTTCWQ